MRRDCYTLNASTMPITFGIVARRPVRESNASMICPVQGDLFDPSPQIGPPGMEYEPEFLSPDEESALIRLIRSLPLTEMRYKAYTARRRVISFGGQYD